MLLHPCPPPPELTEVGVGFSQNVPVFVSLHWQWRCQFSFCLCIRAGSLEVSHNQATTGFPWKSLWQLNQRMVCELSSHHHSDQFLRGGSTVTVTHSNADQMRKTHFVWTRVENWKCSTLTALHAWHTSGAILSDNIIKVSCGLSVLFGFLYYEDVVAFSKWMNSRITFWKGNVNFQKGAEWPSHFMLYCTFLRPRCQLPFQRT